jgi:hypothetical protein
MTSRSSFSLNPTVFIHDTKTTTSFLPPGTANPYHQKNYEKSLSSIAGMDPQTILRNVQINYSVTSLKHDPERKEIYPVTEKIKLTRAQLKVDTFRALLACCNPDKYHSIEQVTVAWQEFPPTS